jgi:hypothetical protein
MAMSALVKMVGGALFIRAYDSSGTNRPWHRIEDGDRIEWKRSGSRGFARARVLHIDPVGRLTIRPVDAAGQDVPFARARNIMAPAVAYIFDQATGRRREPATAQELV